MKNSFSSHNPGTIGWQSPELLRGDRQSKKVDVFSLGCLIYFFLTDGFHPFGGKFHRESNIIQNNPNLNKLDRDPIAQHLILGMIHFNPIERFSAEEVENHIYFWSDNKKLLFLKDASDRLEIEKADAPLVLLLESSSQLIFSSSSLLNKKKGNNNRNNNRGGGRGKSFSSSSLLQNNNHNNNLNHLNNNNNNGGILSSYSNVNIKKQQANWLEIIDQSLRAELEAGKHRKYNGFSIRDLLRVIRNKSHHYRDLPQDMQILLGDLPSGFLGYFHTKFPLLIVEVYSHIRRYCLNEPSFHHYFFGED